MVVGTVKGKVVAYRGMHDPEARGRKKRLNLREAWCGCATEGLKRQLHCDPLTLVDVAPGLEGEPGGAAERLTSPLVHPGKQHTVRGDRHLLPRCTARQRSADARD
eukprot:6611893-Prymnesium_polylepis.1